MPIKRGFKIEQLKEVIEFYPGGCMCGHGESCGVCSRSQGTRTQEAMAREMAIYLLRKEYFIEARYKYDSQAGRMQDWRNWTYTPIRG
jgi:hypothetical protein